jgi:hypothetical protein
MPKGGFRVLYAREQSGSPLQYSDVSRGGFYGVDVYLKRPIILGQKNTFLLYAVVSGMVYPDSYNIGNVGLLFSPSTFLGASGSIGNLRVSIVLPPGASVNEVKYYADTPFGSISVEGNSVAVYWERSNWPPSTPFTVGLSFPDKYVSLGLTTYLPIIICVSVLSTLTVLIAVVYFRKRRKSLYEKPRIYIEALGAARNLTAVEAGVVLGLKPVRVLTMILFGLLLKRIVTVASTDPFLRLQQLERSHEAQLRYYEMDFLKAIEPDGSLDETALARTYLYLRENVDRKLRGYSREDTINYYKSVVDRAWNQVIEAGTPELKGDALDNNIEWLIVDEGFSGRLKVAFPPDLIIYPDPRWWWYWHGPYITLKQRSTTEPQPIPGRDFANIIVQNIEKAANTIVKDVQDFTNRLLPSQAALLHERSVRGQSSCVCACAHCACACACVSCACACAHGGAR